MHNVIVEVTESEQKFCEINFFTKQKMCGNEDTVWKNEKFSH